MRARCKSFTATAMFRSTRAPRPLPSAISTACIAAIARCMRADGRKGAASSSAPVRRDDLRAASARVLPASRSRTFRLTPLDAQAGDVRKARPRSSPFVQHFDQHLRALAGRTSSSSACWSRASASRTSSSGYDFYFGHKRGGNPEMMRAAPARPRLRRDRHAAGRGGRRSVLLVRHPSASGAGRRQRRRARARARRGACRARSSAAPSAAPGIGFPTANIPHAEGHGARPRHLRGARARRRRARTTPPPTSARGPTFDNGMPVLEVFLFDFDGDLYGHEIEVEFVDFIRDDRKFDSAKR